MSMPTPPFLKIRGLKTHFPVEKGLLVRKTVATVKAVDGIDLDLNQGEILGLVGESGCGKSTLGRTILQLIEPTQGSVHLNGRCLTELKGKALRESRKDFQMIFQDPYASLNPRMTVYDTLAEALLSHQSIPKSELSQRVGQWMNRVGLSPRFIKKYPHEFSGGQRQRIAIARALVVEPKLLIADEAVSALDVSIQAQIINLLARLSKEMNLTMIFISHDLSVVKHIADRIAVMYLGRMVELGSAESLFDHPRHPYTQALVSAVPIPDPSRERTRRRMLLPGDPPSPMHPPSGCSFHPRCPHAADACQVAFPDWVREGDRSIACSRLEVVP